MTRISSIIAAALCAVASVNAFSVGRSPSSSSLVGTSVSGFGGRVLLTKQPESNTANTLTMKKGANVPPQMRSNFKRNKEMSQMREEMEASSRPGADGFPIFNLYVRSQKSPMWYPCGSFKGDEKSAALATSWRDDGLLSGISKNQLDSGIAGSLFRDIPKLKESIFRTYPQLRKAKDELEWGYKLSFEGLSKEQEKTWKVEPKEMKGVFDGVKGVLGLN